MLIYEYSTEYCLLFVVLMMLPLLCTMLFVLFQFNTHRSCAALLLLLLCPCMLYFQGLPFVVGLPLLLLARVFSVLVIFSPVWV